MNSAASQAKWPHEPPWWLASSRASSTGLIPCSNTSIKRNTRMPMATALSIARTRGAGLRMRPIGSPRKIVDPAIPPNSSTRTHDIVRQP